MSEMGGGRVQRRERRGTQGASGRGPRGRNNTSHYHQLLLQVSDSRSEATDSHWVVLLVVVLCQVDG